MARTILSPLRMVLCAVFLFTAHVYAASAVLGVDLGTEYIKASLVKPGIPLDIVLTKDSRRKETSAVAFKRPQNGPKKGEFPERLYGSDAIALSARFPGDVYPNLKTLLGLPVDSPAVKEYAARHPALQLESHKVKNTAAFKSKDAFTPEEQAWLVEELLAMELQSIQKNAENMAGPGTSVRSVVLTVPAFYTTEEKRAVETAVELAGLKVLSLISDGLAVGVNYASSRTFPNINEGGKPEHHMVFDMGAGSTKATILKMQGRTVKDVGKFNKTVQEVLVLGSGWDRSLGGDALNAVIVDDMIEKFVQSSGAKKVGATVEGVKAHGRAMAKLSKDAERLRHVLSANQNTQASFEGLYEDVDFKYKITRAEFEAMAEAHASRVAVAIQGALDMASLKVEDLDSVILHGGATRTPFVQKELEKVFGAGDKIRTNVNSDESAVFGAGLRAAELSPSFRVKEIRIYEGAAYPAGITWVDDKGKTRHQRLWTTTSHLGATAKEVTFNNKDDFSVEFYQEAALAADVMPGFKLPAIQEKATKIFNTKNLTETVSLMKEKYSCEPSDVQFKFGVRLAGENGEVEVTQAYVECEAEVVEKESLIDGVKNMFGFGKKDEQKPLADGESSESAEDASTESAESSSSTTSTDTTESTSSTSSTASSATTTEAAEAKEGKKTKKIVSVPVKFELEKAGSAQLDKLDTLQSKDRLKAFEQSDKLRRQREEALNQLEGFTYKIRDLLESESFIAASTEKERKALEQKGSEASDWLYGDGADASKDELKKRIKGLQDIVTPIQNRIEESTERPKLLEGLKKALKQTDEFVKDIKQKIAESEAWSSSRSASATASSESSTVTAAPSDDFADLEDDSTTSTTKSPTMEDVVKDRGPVPPLYTLEDLKETEDLFAKITAWLEKKEPAQEKLGATDDPVLTVKSLKEWREKLDKAGQDLALKSVNNFKKKNKANPSKSKKSKATKSKATPGSEQTIEIGKDGKMPSEEELQEMIRKFTEEAAAREAAAKTEETGSEEKMKDSDEHKRDEL